MIAHVLKGSKQEIAANLTHIHGEVREAIVFEEEPATTGAVGGMAEGTDIFAEMHALMVDVPNIDDSREAIYTRQDGE
ncbi:MAG TPA: hypothetical protein VHR66_32475 [Gemmataceae bacterium]|jgi:hypothetical protein|nr:hypothetical protein [Gemmataceae bacterium]